LQYLRIKTFQKMFHIVLQVGDADSDHGWWGRPEDNPLYRPAFELSDRAPGSDLLGETAAALAASYLVFRDSG
jgi:endoglucanase